MPARRRVIDESVTNADQFRQRAGYIIALCRTGLHNRLIDRIQIGAQTITILDTHRGTGAKIKSGIGKAGILVLEDNIARGFIQSYLETHRVSRTGMGNINPGNGQTPVWRVAFQQTIYRTTYSGVEIIPEGGNEVIVDGEGGFQSLIADQLSPDSR